MSGLCTCRLDVSFARIIIFEISSNLLVAFISSAETGLKNEKIIGVIMANKIKNTINRTLCVRFEAAAGVLTSVSPKESVLCNENP